MRTVDPWYELVIGSDVLMQGDLLESCPTVELNWDEDTKSRKAIENDLNVVLISQSCELAEARARVFMVCQYVSLSKFKEKLKEAGANANSRRSVDGDLSAGRRVGYHALNPCVLSGHEMVEPLVVDFHNVYGVSLADLRSTAGKADSGRLRLRSPYRESLSQAYAQYFMKVALPVGYYSPIGQQDLPPEDAVANAEPEKA